MFPELKVDAVGVLQSSSPPAPDGPFLGDLRLYLPKPEITSGQCLMPLLTPVESQQ
jgi:hypothetical protein